MECSLLLDLPVQMFIATISKASKSHTCVNFVNLFHYTISVTTFNVYYSNHYWTHKCQAVRNLVQWPRYNMDDGVFCLDSGHRQQKFLFSSAFRSAVERCRYYQHVQLHTCHVICTGGNIISNVCLDVLRKQLHIWSTVTQLHLATNCFVNYIFARTVQTLSTLQPLSLIAYFKSIK